VDAEFQRALIVVLIAGSIVIAIGAAAVYFVLRGFGDAKAGGKRHVLLIVALVGFVLACCVGLFFVSYAAP
jgi:hypothetical protein